MTKNLIKQEAEKGIKNKKAKQEKVRRRKENKIL